MRSFLVVLLTAPLALVAQPEFPAPSPMCTMQQKVGLTDVTLMYSRPGMKDRTIYGDLLPYGEMWRLGANASTKIEFSEDVTVMGNELKAGKYAPYAIPGEDEWTIVFHTNLEHWGVGGDEYKAEEDAFRVTVKPTLIHPKVESLLLDINNIRNASASLDITWENVRVSVPIEFKTVAQIDEAITKHLEGPDWRFYYSAARFYRESGQKLDTALEWMSKSIEMRGETFWNLRQKSLIQADLGDYQGAIATAKRSLELANEEGNKDYVKMNTDSIAEWGKKAKG